MPRPSGTKQVMPSKRRNKARRPVMHGGNTRAIRTIWAALLCLASVTQASEPACWLDPIKSESDFDYEKLKTLIEKKNIRSIDKLAPKLGNCRELWTACYRSRSPEAHLASGAAPRVIMVCPDAQLTIAYSDCAHDPSAKGNYPECEEIQTASVEHEEVVFREIRLPGKGAPDHLRAIYSPDNRSTSPHKKTKNCTSCHQDPARWNWDSYNFWPGCFGSLSRRRTDVIQAGSPEEKMYRKFLKHVWKKPANHRRYTSLAWQLDPVLYNSDLERTAQLPELSPIGLTGPTSKLYTLVHGRTIDQDPNAKITDVLGRANFRRILHQIVSSPRFAEHATQLVAASFDKCVRSQEFIELLGPQEHQRFMEDPALEDELHQHFLRTSAAVLADNPVPLGLGAFRPLDAVKSDREEELQWPSRLLFIAKAMAIDTRNWGMPLYGTRSFTVPTSSTSEFNNLFSEYISKCIPDRKRIANLVDRSGEIAPHRDTVCKEVYDAFKPLSHVPPSHKLEPPSAKPAH